MTGSSYPVEPFKHPQRSDRVHTTMMPQDLKTAASTFQHLRREVATHRETASQVLTTLVILGLASTCTWVLLPEAAAFGSSQAGTLLLAVAGAVLTYAAVLVGFVVSLMLFTGRISNSEARSLEDLSVTVDRTRYLLYSQMITLFAAVGLAGLTLFSSLLLAIDAPALSTKIVLSVAGGFAAVCVIRTLLLPLQIYELHEESFRLLLIEKARATRAIHQARGSSNDSEG